MSDHKLDTCGCCEGENRLTPADTYNRPGLDALAFRVGTHAAFFETMIADLAREEIALETIDPDGEVTISRVRPLQSLKTRRRDDFSIALLDAWATIADVLAFYQERIANEGYLRTATERRSILELARLVGYELRPGVAASTYLSFIVEQAEQPALIPKGTRAQSIPAPGESMESFETQRDLEARYEYNELKLRLAQPQFLEVPTLERPLPGVLYLPGQRTDLQQSDRLLLAFGTANDNGSFEFPPKDASYYLVQVHDTSLLDQPARTAVRLQPEVKPISNPRSDTITVDWREGFSYHLEQWYLEQSWSDVIGDILKRGALPIRLPESVFVEASNQDVGFQGVAVINTQFAENIYDTMGQEVAPLDPGTEALRALVLLRLQARLHGHDAPFEGVTQQIPGSSPRQFKTFLSEWPDPGKGDASYNGAWNDLFSQDAKITLNGVYEQIGKESLIVLAWQKTNEQGKPEAKQALFQVTGTDVTSTSLFNVPATATRLQLQKIKGHTWDPTSMAIIRSTTVYAASEFVRNPVPFRILAGEPLTEALGPVTHVVQKGETLDIIARRYGVSKEVMAAINNVPIDSSLDIGQTLIIPIETELELDGIYNGLKPGRWITITGMRTDIPVVGREVALIQAVEHRFAQLDDETDLPGDLRHTFVTLATPLNLSYQRDTVRISANVVPATHGETARGVPPREHDVVLGSGDGAQAHQRFPLKLQPGKRLTYLSAPTRDGVESTLKVYVNDVQWHPVRTLVNTGPTDRVYTVQTDDDGQTAVIFGDGVEGARPPTGRENVWARYRIGIGKAGNVKAGQISLLATRPAGVKEVSNPIAATGGTDPESRDRARHSVKFSVRTLDRLVGLQDYEDFARTFAGIGKAKSCEPESKPTEITVYVAGEDNAPLTQDSELIRNLKKALDEHDGSDMTIQVVVFTPRLITLEATVHIAPDYLWEKVQPAIQSALSMAFGFAQRELGQAVALSEIVATIQRVPGVTHVQITYLDALTEEQLVEQASGSSTTGTGEEVTAVIEGEEEDEKAVIEVEEYQLAFIDPTVPSLIVLKEPDTQTEGEQA